MTSLQLSFPNSLPRYWDKCSKRSKSHDWAPISARTSASTLKKGATLDLMRFWISETHTRSRDLIGAQRDGHTVVLAYGLHWRNTRVLESIKKHESPFHFGIYIQHGIWFVRDTDMTFMVPVPFCFPVTHKSCKQMPLNSRQQPTIQIR